MRLFLYITLLAIVCATACTAEETLTDADCTALPADQCEANGCGESVTVREVTAEEPIRDDHCFGEETAICSRNAELLQNNALCIYAWRNTEAGTRVIRLNSSEVPDGWDPCDGDADEPPQCVCTDLGGCGR